jgi:hypothetical protein
LNLRQELKEIKDKNIGLIEYYIKEIILRIDETYKIFVPASLVRVL